MALRIPEYAKQHIGPLHSHTLYLVPPMNLPYKAWGGGVLDIRIDSVTIL
jgi:hypothetical protein